MTSENFVQQVAPEIYQVKIPLPFALNIVNCYLLRDGDGWTLIDCGINTAKGRETWQQAFTALAMRPRDIRRIVLTHVHPDHYGLAGWLQATIAADGGSATVWTTPREKRQAQLIWQGGSTLPFGVWLRQNGMPDDMAERVDSSMDDTRAMTQPAPDALHTLEIGTPLVIGARTYETSTASGHSDGHLLLFSREDGIMISGDHVLMKITPNIGLWTETDAQPLRRYLTSLRALQSLPVTLGLSGHKTLVQDWGGRIAELLHHHDERLQHVQDAVAAGARTPYDVSLHIFPTERFTAHEWRFALAESLAHLDYLHAEGVLTAEGGDRPRYHL